MNFSYVDPKTLIPSPWNPNKVSAENIERLSASIDRIGNYKPIICRELDDGTLQILGGHHRVEVSISQGQKTVPVINLGRIDDTRAKEITLLDNAQYGSNDVTALQSILSEIGTADDIISFMPFGAEQLNSILETDVDVDIDEMLGDLEDDDGVGAEELAEKKSAPDEDPTKMFRARLSLEDYQFISSAVQSEKDRLGLTDVERVVADGIALTSLLEGLKK